MEHDHDQDPFTSRNMLAYETTATGPQGVPAVSPAAAVPPGVRPRLREVRHFLGSLQGPSPMAGSREIIAHTPDLRELKHAMYVLEEIRILLGLDR